MGNFKPQTGNLLDDYLEAEKRIEELEAELAASEKIEGVIKQAAQERIEELEALIDRTIEWKESMPELILKNFLRENYLPLSNLIDDMRKARGTER